MDIEQQRARKTYTYKLMPTPEQERAMERVLWRCRELYNAGLEERTVAWQRCHVSVTFAMQSAQLLAIKEFRPEYNALNAQVLQDVLHRLDPASAACFRRVQAGARHGYPRLHGLDRYTSLTYSQVGAHGGATLDGGLLTLSTIGRLRLRLHRPLHDTPKTVAISCEPDGWYTCGMPASRVRTCRSSRCRPLDLRPASTSG